ncbi:hypothetical protein [Alicyclobacillus sp. SO9]|uniref:hypothetical protein n=1 Tax=Alicyclobacillus sp. SO9 TaxID=2665646 RepID=UPI0018E8B421|nr:hypothetical protein [Alicyclobacillus sp. SO9]QQE77638.1 hypothetical protein GI364_17090 [Alicyclobacillus sp. SO9]
MNYDEQLEDVRKQQEHHEKRIRGLEEKTVNLENVTQESRAEQVNLREYTRARFDHHDEKLEDLKSDLKTFHTQNQELHEKLTHEVNEKMIQSLRGAAASNPVWVTSMISLLVGISGIIMGAVVAWAIAHHYL